MRRMPEHFGCLAGLVLGIERVEGEIEIVLGRLAGVDRAAKDFSFGCRLQDHLSIMHR